LSDDGKKSAGWEKKNVFHPRETCFGNAGREKKGTKGSDKHKCRRKRKRGPTSLEGEGKLFHFLKRGAGERNRRATKNFKRAKKGGP